MKHYEVTVLKPGYATWVGPTQQHADGSITLVRGPTNVIVDTGGPWDRQALLSALKNEGLNPRDIHYVVCTHGHSDHVGNVNLFPEATLILSYDVCKGDLYTFHEFVHGQPYKIDDEVEVIATPGHTKQDISVIVSTREGTYAIVGDLFECGEDLDNEDLWRSFSEFPDEQVASRKKILELADLIVPGHGDAFEVPGKTAPKPPWRSHGEKSESRFANKIVWYAVVPLLVLVVGSLLVWLITRAF
jgi:glyoxylase-like metal-dependent hydrolase (beta-lactamase superfamily II)